MLEGAELRAALGDAAFLGVEGSVREIATSVLGCGTDFLFGAGMSIEAGLPSGPAVAAKLLRRMFPDTGRFDDAEIERLSQVTSLEAVAEAVMRTLPEGKRSLLQAVTDMLHPGGRAPTPSAAHASFARLIRWGGQVRIHRAFTTNFDDLLEQVIGDSCVRVTEGTTRRYEEALVSGRIPVVYVHGRLDEGNAQIAESDVVNPSRLRSVDAIFQNRLFDSEVFCMVGYSMSDPDILRIYRQFREQLRLRQEHEKWTYVVHPVRSAAEFVLHQEVWQSRGALFLPLKGQEFFELLNVDVQIAHAERDVDDLLTAYNWTRGDLSARVEKLKDALDLKQDEDAYELLRRMEPVGAGVGAKS